jgi:hypothetical protein
MAIRNQAWYNLNSTRDYPLADTASAISDAEDRLPQTIITDLRIRWPDLLGAYTFFGSVSATKGAVTATILASPDLSNAGSSYTPVASISVPLASLVIGKQYPLEAMYPAVFGYIAFGEGALVPWRGAFSSPEQSLLTSRAARAHAALPVSSLGRLHDAVALTGVVNINATKPLEIVKGERDIGGIIRDTIILRLRDESNTGIESDNTPQRVSAFEEYVGECGKRPESNNCGNPIPFETINAVPPDCDGIVCINFKGCATVGKNTDDCGIVVDCDIGLSETCDPPQIPTLEGVLPSEKTPSIPPVPPDPEPDPPDAEDSVSDTVVTSITLPYCDAFEDEIADNFSVISGSWVFVPGNSPDELCEGAYSYSTESGVSGGTQNISLFTADAQTLYRKYQTDMKIMGGDTGMKRNGGIIVDYKATGDGTSTFFLLELSHDDAEFRLVYYNGLAYVPLATQVLPELALEYWYNLELRVHPSASLTGITFHCILTGITDTSVSVTMDYTSSWSNYREDSELAGFHTDRAYARFSYWRVSEYVP